MINIYPSSSLLGIAYSCIEPLRGGSCGGFISATLRLRNFLPGSPCPIQTSCWYRLAGLNSVLEYARYSPKWPTSSRFVPAICHTGKSAVMVRAVAAPCQAPYDSRLYTNGFKLF